MLSLSFNRIVCLLIRVRIRYALRVGRRTIIDRTSTRSISCGCVRRRRRRRRCRRRRRRRRRRICMVCTHMSLRSRMCTIRNILTHRGF